MRWWRCWTGWVNNKLDKWVAVHYNSVVFINPKGYKTLRMNVVFVSERLAELLQSSKAIAREYGPENAKTIGLRLNSLYAADNLQVVAALPGRLEELKGDRAGTFSLRLKHGFRLVFAPQDPDSARRSDGTLEWTRVRAVIVLEVVNYHD